MKTIKIVHTLTRFLPFAILLGMGISIPYPMIILALGCFALICSLLIWRRVSVVDDIALLGVIVFGGVFITLNLPPFPASLAVISSLAAWDLGAFGKRISGSNDEITNVLIHRHVRFLAACMGAAVIMCVLTGLIQIRMTFWWVFLAGLILVVAIRQVIVELKQLAP